MAQIIIDIDEEKLGSIDESKLKEAIESQLESEFGIKQNWSVVKTKSSRIDADSLPEDLVKKLGEDHTCHDSVNMMTPSFAVGLHAYSLGLGNWGTDVLQFYFDILPHITNKPRPVRVGRIHANLPEHRELLYNLIRDTQATPLQPKGDTGYSIHLPDKISPDEYKELLRNLTEPTTSEYHALNGIHNSLTMNDAALPQ